MSSTADVLISLAPIITAATPVVLVVVNWWVTRQQSKDLKAHSDENMAKINAVTAESTGTHKILPDSSS